MKFLYIRVAKTIEYKGNLDMGPEILLLYNEIFVISVFFITRVHCTVVGVCDLLVIFPFTNTKPWGLGNS